MNKHGQSLITFVLILPILVLFIVFFVNSMQGLMNKDKMEGIIKSNLEIILKNDIKDKDRIEKVIKENEKDIELVTNILDEEITINSSLKKKNLFENIFKWQEIKVCLKGNYINKKISKCNG